MRKRELDAYEKKKRPILNTVITYWQVDTELEEGGYYLTASPLATYDTLGMDVVGTGYTAEESEQVFEELLDETLKDYFAGRMSSQRKAGQPAKPNQNMLVRLKPFTKECIKLEAAKRGITQGEYIEYLVARVHSVENTPYFT
jgi:predicted DNA binding CopG/RHH family protein